jgi:hypothetical protein
VRGFFVFVVVVVVRLVAPARVALFPVRTEAKALDGGAAKFCRPLTEACRCRAVIREAAADRLDDP